jgi:transposase
MGKPHHFELRERVLAVVAEGHSQRSAAARFRVSVKFVNDRVILKGETGGLRSRRQGNGGGHGKLEPVRAWRKARMAQKGT